LTRAHALSFNEAELTQRRGCLIHLNVLPQRLVRLDAGACLVRRKGFNVRVSKLSKILLAVVLLALSCAGASAQSKNDGAKSQPKNEVAQSSPSQAGDVPVIVMHLPDWERKVKEGAVYAGDLTALQKAAGNRPALDAVPFDSSVEAATADYDGARLVVVEFPTPQHSVDADAAINERITQLRAAGQPVPSAYKRVGNYSVFVFDAPDAARAENLLSQVKYEKDVRWLGRNPHAYEIASQRYTRKMGNVILTTLISTGLAILFCLGVGGIIGGIVFLRRRAQHTAQEIYSDAGGMLRLNIEDVNMPRPTTKLLGRNEE
jgi:hypothetical protein